MLLQSSQDVFYLTLAFATVLLASFLAWLLYYLISILRQSNEVMKEVTSGITKVHKILDALHETVSRSASHLSLIVGGIRELLTFYQRRRRSRETTNASASTRSSRSSKSR